MTFEDIFIFCKQQGYSQEYADYWATHPRCEICGRKSSPPHHIRSRGAGGKDNPENLMSLCPHHHTLSWESVHIMGWETFAQAVCPPHLRDKMYKAMNREPAHRAKGKR